MTKNEIFKKFLQNQDVRNKITLGTKSLDKLDLYSPTEDKLLEVIKTTILHTEGEDSIELSARRINQFFKKGTV